ILAPINIIHLNGNRFGEVNVDDRDNPFSTNSTLNVVNDVGTLSGLAPGTITFDAFGMGGMTLQGGSHGNTFNVFGTFAGDHHDLSGIGHTLIDAGTGNDTVNLFGTGDGFVIIDGQNGHDNVFLGSSTQGMQGIHGTVQVRNLFARSSLFVDDSA